MSSSPRRRALAALAVLGGVAGLELVAAAFAYRTRVRAGDWELAAAALAALPSGEPVVLAEEWLGPQARAQLPALGSWVGLPDLHGAPRVHVLALGDPRSASIRADLAGLDPAPGGREELGALTLHHWELAGAGAVGWDLLADRALALRDARGPCKVAQRTWSCKQGRAEVRFAEVGYRPRRCLALDFEDGASVELSARAELGARLRGHLGFSDFNGRARNDAPVLVELEIGGAPRARWALTDNQGWVAFEVPTEPGLAELRLRITTLLGGTFTPAGYDSGARRTPCLELRALTSP